MSPMPIREAVRRLDAAGLVGRWEHRAILEACIAHDADGAAIALQDHLARTANNISRAMGGEELFELSG